MKLNLLYLLNETGEKLLERIKEEWNRVAVGEVELDASKYLLIEINDVNNGYERTINTPQAIRACLNEETIAGILGVNRIAYGSSDEEGFIRRYNVLVCDNTIISTQVKYQGKNKEQVKYIKEVENIKVAQLARRVFQLMGLDLGMISIGLTLKRRWRVIGLDPSPIIRDKDLEQLLRRINNFYNSEEYLRNNNVKMGADPEFMLVNTRNNKLMAASEYFPRDGLVGCDNIRIPNRQQRPVAEIRPKPDESPLKLVENIKQALLYAGRLAPYQSVKWVAGSQPVGAYSIGGHIHFSRIQANGWFLIALDNYLAIPVLLIEQPSSASKRRKKYGFLGDYRTKDHGGFEYRTPGSWLVSREISTAVLCLAKIVACNYPRLNQNYLNNVEAQKAFYSCDQKYFAKIFTQLWKEIEKTNMFNEFSEYLKILPEMISQGQHWDEKADMRKAWGISTSRKSSLNENNNDKPLRSSPSGGNARAASVFSGRATRSEIAGSLNARSFEINNPSRSQVSGNIRSSTRPGRITAPQQIRRAHSIR